MEAIAHLRHLQASPQKVRLVVENRDDGFLSGAVASAFTAKQAAAYFDVRTAAKGEGRAVFVCLHPTERYHLEILKETCERFIFVDKGRITLLPDWSAAEREPRVATYLGIGGSAARRTA